MSNITRCGKCDATYVVKHKCGFKNVSEYEASCWRCLYCDRYFSTEGADEHTQNDPYCGPRIAALAQVPRDVLRPIEDVDAERERASVSAHIKPDTTPCDLCRQKIPDADIASGKARRSTDGRMLCEACDVAVNLQRGASGHACFRASRFIEDVNGMRVVRADCECGGTKAGTPHSTWCPARRD